MTEEVIEATEEVITRSEKDANRKAVFDSFYDILRKFSATDQRDIENIRHASRMFSDTIEKIAEHRARVICGEYIKLIKDDIGEALKALKPKEKDKSVKDMKFTDLKVGPAVVVSVDDVPVVKPDDSIV